MPPTEQVTAVDAPAPTPGEAAPPPEPKPVPVVLKATILDGGPLIERDLAWTVTPASGGAPVFDARAGVAETTLATVSAPASVKAGAELAVRYVGPGFEGDRIVLVAADMPDDKMWGVTVNADFAVSPDATTGTIPGRLTAKPGEYELRYVTGKQHRVLARHKVTITP